jgi:hypothetical protein
MAASLKQTRFYAYSIASHRPSYLCAFTWVKVTFGNLRWQMLVSFEYFLSILAHTVIATDGSLAISFS